MIKVDAIIIGLTNKGKSTLFNTLTEQKLSLTYDEDDVTRDYVIGKYTVGEEIGYVMDTPGIHQLKPWIEKYKIQLTSSSVILFVVNGHDSISIDEKEMIRKVSQYGEVILIRNFADRGVHDERLSLPIKEEIALCALSKSSVNVLRQSLPLRDLDPSKKPGIVIIGHTNSGKSTLVNALCGFERSITSDESGTTRDILQTDLEKFSISVYDTPGHTVKRNQKFSSILQENTAKFTTTPIGQLLVIDGSIGIRRSDKVLLSRAQYDGIFTIVCINKSDDLCHNIKYEMEKINIANHVPVMYVSAITGRNINRLRNKLKYLSYMSTYISTSQLNRLLSKITSEENIPSLIKSIKYMTVVSYKPIKMLYFAHHPLPKYHQKYLKRCIIEKFKLDGYNIILSFQKK